MGGILHLRLNMGGRPIANKHREGKMKSTLKRECKELEIVEREAIGDCERVPARTECSERDTRQTAGACPLQRLRRQAALTGMGESGMRLAVCKGGHRHHLTVVV